MALERERALRRAVFAAPPSLTLSEWADRYRVLSSETSGEPGRWRTSRTPYLREIMDACTDPRIERVVFMKSARVGATDGLINNLLGYWMDQSPGPMLVIQPTVEDAKGWSKEQMEPMLRDTPVLQGKVMDSGRRESKNSLQFKKFPGGYLAVVGSNSAAGFRRRSIKRILADERDGYGVTARGSSGKHEEGDPFALAVKRTQNFWDRFILEASTPTVKGLSAIERSYELSDQRLYFVPCPHCGFEQVFKWSNFRWENEDPQTVHYVCGTITKDGELTEGCGESITEDLKVPMVTAGRWIAQRPGRKVRGYRIWAAYSLLSSWERMVQEFLEARGDRRKLQVFVNTVLGETWEEDVEQVDHGALMARRVNYEAEVPLGVGVLTMGVDVQGDRLEASVWGFGKGEEQWLLRHEVLWGDPEKRAVWDQLDLFRTREWQHQGGQKVRIRATGIDSGGHHTDQVYRYCKRNAKAGVFCMKGSSEPGAAPIGNPGKPTKRRPRLFMIGTVALKDALFSRLRTEAAGPGFLHFPMVAEEYFRQLTAEVPVTHYHRGRPTRRYDVRYDRNEALDCAVMALAALWIMGPVRDQLGKLVAQLAPKDPEAPPEPGPPVVDMPRPDAPRRSTWIPRRGGGWMGGWR